MATNYFKLCCHYWNGVIGGGTGGGATGLLPSGLELGSGGIIFCCGT
jgi:hypothetical protein